MCAKLYIDHGPILLCEAGLSETGPSMGIAERFAQLGYHDRTYSQ